MLLKVEVRTEADGQQVIHGRDVKRFWEILSELLPAHEGSHAVVGLVLGLAVDFVTLDENEATRLAGHPAGGATKPGYDGDPLHFAAFNIAGIVWEVQAGIPLGLSLAASPTDVGRFATAAPTEDERQRAWGLAQEIIEAHRSSIIAIADALVAKRRLSGDEIRSLIDRTTD